MGGDPKHAGWITYHSKCGDASEPPPGVHRRGFRMRLGLWKCWHSLMDGWMDGFSNFLEAQTRINAAQWITYWETKTSAV